MRAQIYTIVVSVMVVAGLASCSQGAAETPRREPAQLELAAAVPIDSQSAGVRVRVFRCGASQPTVTRRLGFTSASLDDLDAFAHKPVGLAKEHFFARESLQLRPGCYYVSAQPLDLERNPRPECETTTTAQVPLGPAARRHFLLVARCGQAPSDLPIVDKTLNFPPAVTELTTRPSASAPAATEVCAQARDAEADRLRLRWSARTDAGRAVGLDRPHHSQQIGSTLTECVRVPSSEHAIEVSATVVDGLDHRSGGFVSHEDLRLHRYGVAAPSRATKVAHIPAARANDCADESSAGVAGWTYWIRRDGEILSPRRELSGLRAGDTVEVEVEVADGCGDVQLSLVAGRAGQVVARDTGKFTPGSHVLWVEAPDDGPFVVALTAKASGRTRVLDSFESGSRKGEG